MKTARYVCLGTFILVVIACNPARGQPTPTGPDPAAVLTAAARTAEAGLTGTAANPAPTASPTPIPPSETPTASEITETTPTASPITPVGDTDDRVEFVADITVADGTTYNAGDTFVKTWRLKNAGTSTWTPQYALVFVGGAQMNAPAALPLSDSIPPGQTVDLSVTLTAPNSPGLQRGLWMLSNAAGEAFGLGPEANQPFFVEINVVGTGDGSADPTPTSAASGSVASISVSVDPASFTGECPHTFTFVGQINMASPARVTIQMEAGATDPTYQFNLPAAQTLDFGQGSFQVQYTLELRDSVSGWVRLRITSPDDLRSNQANFSLSCQ